MPGVKYVSLHEYSGYGEAAQRYLRALVRSGVQLTWTPMVRGRGWGLGYEPYTGRDIGEPWLRPYCNRKIEYDRVIVHTVPEYFPLWKERERGKIVIGYTVWETDRPPRHWAPLLNGVDRLAVPCRWNRELFRQHGVTTPIAVVPHLPPEMESLAPPEALPRPNRPFTFYTIGAWTTRKAVWLSIEAYLRAFSGEESVLLVVKTTKRDFTRRGFGPFFARTSRRVGQIVRRHPRPAAVRLLAEELSQDEMAALHRSGDCYLSLCRSEGWGLGAYDAACLGRPVVMTGYGGQLDYLDARFSYLVDYDLVPVEDPMAPRSYDRGQHWAEPRIDHAATLLRQVFEDQEPARSRARRLAESLSVRFDAAGLSRILMELVGT